MDDADNIGPTYAVWTAEQDDHTQQWVWRWDANYSCQTGPLDSEGRNWHDCDDDPDGKHARAAAHEYARYLRKTYPCAYVAVLPASKQPLPIHDPDAFASEGDFRDFSSSWLGQ